MIFFTSNLGSVEMQRIATGSFGFSPPKGSSSPSHKAIENAGLEKARSYLLPEFFNRLDATIVFENLEDTSLRDILRLELMVVQGRIGERCKLYFSDGANQFLLQRGVDHRYGARHLRRVIQRFVSNPLAGFLTSGQISKGESVYVTVSKDDPEVLDFGVGEVALAAK